MKRAFLLLTLVLVAQRQSADLTLSTIPTRVFKENDGVVDAADSETFIFWIVVGGTGPAPEPLRGEVQLFSGAELIGTHNLAAPFLKGVRGVSFTSRLIEEPELFDLRHHFSVPVSADVNRVVYKLSVAMPRGELTRTVEFAVQRYQPRSEHPHLHYQLMSGTHLTRSDGLPSQFVNVWLEDTRAREPIQIQVPKRGIQLVAR
jgi:hypothetical protein